VADAAILLSPDDTTGWFDAMQMLLMNERRAAELRAQALIRARAFDWDRTALATFKVYEEVAGWR
jgi:glycosyltransferase involved in cell wall biosynthesis